MRALFFNLLTATALFAQPLDTLLVAQRCGGDSIVIMVFTTPYSVDTNQNRMSIQCRNIYRDSLGIVRQGELAWRIQGADTVLVKLRATTDSLPGAWGQVDYILDPDGYFVRRE